MKISDHNARTRICRRPGVLAADCASRTASSLTVAPSPVGVVDAANRSREIDS
jgi:hypothetical protein